MFCYRLALFWIFLCTTSVALRTSFSGIVPELVRVDTLLVSKGLCRNRAAAKRAIEQGLVTTRSGQVVKKASKQMDKRAFLAVNVEEELVASPDVGKFSAALRAFQIDLANASFLHVGFSPGFVTDFAMKSGAAVAVGIDNVAEVSNQNTQIDSKAIVLSGVNISNAKAVAQLQLPRTSFDVVTVDVSNAPLWWRILPPMWGWLDANNPKARLLVSVKPKVVRKKHPSFNDVSKQVTLQMKALDEIAQFARSNLAGCAFMGSVIAPSPLHRSDEFFTVFAPTTHGDELQRGPYVCKDDFEELQQMSERAKSNAASRAAAYAAAHRKQDDNEDSRKDDNEDSHEDMLKLSNRNKKRGKASGAEDVEAVRPRTRGRSRSRRQDDDDDDEPRTRGRSRSRRQDDDDDDEFEW